MVQRHLDHLPNAMLVHLVHAERLDVVLFEDGLLAGLYIAQADVDETRWGEAVLHPGERREIAEAEKEGDRHAV